MSDSAVVASASPTRGGTCSCCGATVPHDRWLPFHSQPDAGVCFGCLNWLRRARLAKRGRPVVDSLRNGARGLQRRARALLQRIRSGR